MCSLVVKVVSVIAILRQLFQIHLDYPQIFTIVMNYFLKRLLSHSLVLDDGVNVWHDVFFNRPYFLIV